MVEKREKLKKIIWYVFIATGILFSLGSLVEHFIVKNFIIYMATTGWMKKYSVFLVALALILFLIMSLFIAKWLATWIVGAKKGLFYYHFILVLLILYAVAILYWCLPDNSSQITSDNDQFVGGPYPNHQEISNLKKKGYSGVISLLDSRLLIIESFLVYKEEKLVEKSGLKFIAIPLLPYGSQDPKELDKIADLIKNTPNAKYYVNSYHGDDRVQRFMKIVNKMLRENKDALGTENQGDPLKEFSQLSSVKFMRGDAIRLDNQVIIAPRLTDAEFKNLFIRDQGNLMGLRVRFAVSLNPDDEINFNELQEWFRKQGVEYLLMPITIYPYDALEVLAITQKVKALSGAVLVYSYYMPPESIASFAFIISYLTNLPCLPPSLFANEFPDKTQLQIVLPNVALGERPDANQFNYYFFSHGIRALAYIGSCNDRAYQEDSKFAAAAHLELRCFSASDKNLYATLATGGPWYVYGPDLAKIKENLYRYFYKELQQKIQKNLRKTN